MKRIPANMLKLFDTSNPTMSAFSMILADTKQQAFEDWMEKHGVEKEHAYMNCARQFQRLGMDIDSDYRETTFYKGKPIFSVQWSPKTQSIKVEEHE